MDEQAFRIHSDAALDHLFRALTASNDFPFEADLNNGALTIEFDDSPAKFVVSPNSPVRQIWVSALTTSFKLDWDESRQAFVLPATGRTLRQLMGDVISQQLGETIEL